MKNSVSDHSFYIESDEENDEEKAFEANEDEVNEGNESDSSDGEYAVRHQPPPSSYNSQWPQSYRQSIDLYSSVPSPGMGILNPSSLQRFGSSFLSSSLTRRHTPESLAALTKPLVADQIQPQKSSSYLPPPHRSSSRLSVKKDAKPSTVGHEGPILRNSSYGQAVLNGINVLCGVGILSTPYAVKEGGWLSLLILLAFAAFSFYTGLLLRHCLDSEPGLETYPDIGQAAFGTAGRIAISIILYVELYACCVEYIILEGDNLGSLFPNAHITVLGHFIDAKRLFALMTTLAVLPTVWLRDLSVLSYISAGGVIASVLVVFCLFWVGVEDIGFKNTGTPLNLGTLPVAMGLYGYCYSGHAVFPNIYTSMAKPNQFPSVLLACFAICTALYAGVAVMGYTMFGEQTESQFTLNMPKNLVVSKVAVWTTVVNPFTKYALTMSPVAMSLEELIPSSNSKSRIYAIMIRTALVISTLLVGLSIPFFGLVMSLIGSFLTMLVAFILPCLCFLSILRKKVTKIQIALCVVIIIVGVVSLAMGTYSALLSIVEELKKR